MASGESNFFFKRKNKRFERKYEEVVIDLNQRIKKNMPFSWSVVWFNMTVVKSLESIWQCPIFRKSQCDECHAVLALECWSPWLISSLRFSEDGLRGSPTGFHSD